MPIVLELDSVPPSRPFTSAWIRWRRDLVGRVRRWTRWEFWPPYLFYPPVVAYIAYLGIKFRSWTLFTAANPGIPAGGFVGESKHKILDNLKDAAAWMPCSTLLSCTVPAHRIVEAETFMRQHGLQFPVVLKPDAGQRGSGVSIVRSPGKLRTRSSCRNMSPAKSMEFSIIAIPVMSAAGFSR
jgi:hypothetical protein